MILQKWLHLFIEQIMAASLLEWVAVAFGVAEVLLAKANKIALYPAGIISVIASMLVLYDAGLYAESFLNLYYLVMSVYGWLYWMKKKNEPPVKITRTNRKEWITSGLIIVLGGGLLYFLLKRLTNSTVPLWDAWVSATAWAGMWLLAKRKVENWLLLNVSNFFAVPLFFYKQLPMYALLTVFLFIVACQGYIRWRNESVKAGADTD